MGQAPEPIARLAPHASDAVEGLAPLPCARPVPPRAPRCSSGPACFSESPIRSNGAALATVLIDDKPTVDSWVVGPMLKMITAFEASTKKHPLVAMGTPDPYTPPK